MRDFLFKRYGAHQGFDFILVQHELLFTDGQLKLFKRYLRENLYGERVPTKFDFAEFVEIVEIGLEF